MKGLLTERWCALNLRINLLVLCIYFTVTEQTGERDPVQNKTRNKSGYKIAVTFKRSNTAAMQLLILHIKTSGKFSW